MSLSDNLRRLARERVPTAPAKWLGPITPTVYTNDSTLIETKVSAPDRIPTGAGGVAPILHFYGGMPTNEL